MQLVASSLAVCSSCWGFWSVSGVVLVGAEIREDVRGARGRKCCGEEAADGAASAACAVRVEREDKRRTGRLHGGHRRQRRCERSLSNIDKSDLCSLPHYGWIPFSAVSCAFMPLPIRYMELAASCFRGVY